LINQEEEEEEEKGFDFAAAAAREKKTKENKAIKRRAKESISILYATLHYHNFTGTKPTSCSFGNLSKQQPWGDKISSADLHLQPSAGIRHQQ
jgi:hypothetical protein